MRPWPAPSVRRARPSGSRPLGRRPPRRARLKIVRPGCDNLRPHRRHAVAGEPAPPARRRAHRGSRRCGPRNWRYLTRSVAHARRAQVGTFGAGTRPREPRRSRPTRRAAPKPARAVPRRPSRPVRRQWSRCRRCPAARSCSPGAARSGCCWSAAVRPESQRTPLPGRAAQRVRAEVARQVPARVRRRSGAGVPCGSRPPLAVRMSHAEPPSPPGPASRRRAGVPRRAAVRRRPDLPCGDQPRAVARHWRAPRRRCCARRPGPHPLRPCLGHRRAPCRARSPPRGSWPAASCAWRAGASGMWSWPWRAAPDVPELVQAGHIVAAGVSVAVRRPARPAPRIRPRRPGRPSCRRPGSPGRCPRRN